MQSWRRLGRWRSLHVTLTLAILAGCSVGGTRPPSAVQTSVVTHASASSRGSSASGVGDRPASSEPVVAIEGIVRGPAAGLIANNGAGVIGNNGGRLVTDNGSGVISDHGSSLRVLALDDLTTPVANAVVRVEDVNGQFLPGAAGSTSASGYYRIPLAGLTGDVAFIRVNYQQEGRAVELLAPVDVTNRKERSIAVDPASTLVAKKAQEMVREHRVDAAGLNEAVLTQLSTALAPTLDADAVVAAAILAPSSAAHAFDALQGAKPALAETLAGIASAAGIPALTTTSSPQPEPSPSAPAPADSPSAAASAVPSSAVASPVSAPSAASSAVPSATPSAHVLGTFPVGTQPIGLAQDAQGDIWVSNQGSNNVSRLDTTGAVLGTFGVGNTPTMVAFDPSGNLWVTDSGTGVVSKLSPTGTSLGTYPAKAGARRLGIDSTGRVWTSNYSSNTITQLSSAGAIMQTVTMGTVNKGGPKAIAVDRADNVWVAEGTNPGASTLPESQWTWNLIEYSSAGAKLGTFPAAVDPEAMAFDVLGNLWLANSGAGSVTEVSSAGTQRASFIVGTDPQGLAFDRQGNLWVTLAGEDMVGEFSPNGDLLNKIKVGQSPQSVLRDLAGNLWVTNQGDNTVTKLSP